MENRTWTLPVRPGSACRQENTSGAVPADIEQQQLAALQAMSAFAADDPDKFKALLRGEMKLPTA